MTAAATAPAVDPRRYFESVEARRSQKAERLPVCVYLETTNRCNLLCTTCPRTYAELEPPADMSWALFTSIVDQIPHLERAVLHGVGEPMLVKNLPKMVRYLKDRGTYVLFNTNGTVLNDRNGRALIDAGLDELRVSLDASNAESFLAIRGADFFNRILRNVRRFRELQVREGHERPRVSAWLTGLKETITELPAFVRVAADIGVKEVYLQRLVYFENDAIGNARPDQALFERLSTEEAVYLDEAAALARSLGMTLQRFRCRFRAGHEPRARRRRLALVALPAAVVGDVFHRQRPRAAVLHRAVLAARLRELHARRRHPADACAKSGTARPIPRSARRYCPINRPRPAPIAACAGVFSRARDRTSRRRHPHAERAGLDRRRGALDPARRGRSGHRRRWRQHRPDQGRGACRRCRRDRRRPRLRPRLPDGDGQRGRCRHHGVHGRRRRRRSGEHRRADRADPVGRVRLRDRLARARRARARQHRLAPDRRRVLPPATACGCSMACATPTCARSAPSAATRCSRSTCAR